MSSRTEICRARARRAPACSPPPRYGTPIGDWSNPDTFSSGQPIAQFKRPEGLVLEFTDFINHVIGDDLVSTLPFIFHGHNYDFRSIAPGGLTLFNTASATPLPETVISGFPVIFPYAGSGIAAAPIIK